MNEDSLLKIEEPLRRANSMFLHPPPDIDIKVIKQIGDYSLGTELGSGAFGKVVLGKHILTNELVAIKILDKMYLNNTPDDYQSVKQEISILKSVKHKHIVQLYEVLQTSRHIFIIMEYCEGKDLLDYILTKSKLTEEESLKYFQQLINALFYLHSQNIAHRDIKIDNMLLDRNRDLKLVDFGLSTKYPDDNLLDQPCGTVVYAAPEVLQGREYHGMLADVWSSGIVLYGMLSGYLPFGEQDDDINRQNIITGRVRYPSYFSDCVKDLLMHMLDLDPMTRYTLQEVRNHPWFNLLDYKLIPGIIIGYNIIPVDEKILNLCVTYNYDKEKVRDSVINNKYNSESALYYLLIKKLQKKGFTSVSDFYSDEFIKFVLDDNNLIEAESNNNRNTNKVQESEIKYNININANNNCSAPPDGKVRDKAERREKCEKKEDEKNNSLTPKNSEGEKINKKINFDETPKGVLSFIINTPSFEETNKEIFNIKSSENINNNNYNCNVYKLTNDNESKKTNKNTSSDSKNKNIVYQMVNVNDFQITDDKSKDKCPEQKIINQSELDKITSNNILIDENIKSENDNENDYKILNVLYNNTENNIIHENLLNEELFNNENIISRKNISESNFNKNIFNKTINSTNKNSSKNKKSNIVNSNNNNIFDNSIEILYKANEVKNRNNADILETPIINSKKLDIIDDNMSERLITLDKNINNQFIIETPPNNKQNNQENNINISKNKNTLSKQKVYIDRNKTYSDKKKTEDKNKLDINKIKDIKKVNLFQDEIKEEEINKVQDEKIVLSDITDRELNDKQLNKSIKTISNLGVNDIDIVNIKDKIDNTQNTPIKSIHKEKVDQISINRDSINNKSFQSRDNNNENNKDKNKDNNKDNKDINIDITKDNNKDIKDNNEDNNKDIKDINIDIAKDNNKEKSIELNDIIKNKIILKDNIVKQNSKNNNNINMVVNNTENIKNEVISNKNIDADKENEKPKIIKNKHRLKEGKMKNEEEKNSSIVISKVKKKKNNKALKRKENTNANINNKTKNDVNKSNNPIINSLIRNYKSIVDNNKSTEMKKKSVSKEKNKMNTNYSSKNKLSKNKDREIISIKVIINKNLLSKEKNRNKNITSKNRTEQQDRKIKSIYRVNLPQNNLSKSKYTTIKKKPTVSIFKNKLINNFYTNKKYHKANKIAKGTHIKSSSIHILGTTAKYYRYKPKNINNTTNNSNSLFKINGIRKSKNKNVASSRISNKNKKLIKNNFLVKSYNNKYMKLFKSTQYKNNNFFFTNKIDKTNLNKKFDEIAKKTNNKTRKSNPNNKLDEKKIPLWKFIQSDQHLHHNNSNNKKGSSSPHLSKNNIKKVTTVKVQNKIINNNNKLKDNGNINKSNNMNKSASLSKDKNINVFFINIKNYINNKNTSGNSNTHIKRANKNNIESSATNQRYRSPYEVRELSESVKNKYLNQKTRFNKIPWKVKKKAYDEKIEINDLYKFYMNKNRNPFKKDNKKISNKLYNIKPINNKNRLVDNHSLLYLNSIKGIKYSANNPINYINIKNKINLKQNLNTNIIFTNKKNDNIKTTTAKKYNQSYTPQYMHKKSFFPTFHYLNQRNIFPNKLFHSTNNYNEIKNNSKILHKNYSYVFDLSCVFIQGENINECYQNLIDKLIKKGIYFVQKPNKILRCFKNGLCCEIEILKMDKSDINGKNVFCFKIMGKNGCHVNKMFKNLILEE